MLNKNNQPDLLPGLEQPPASELAQTIENVPSDLNLRMLELEPSTLEACGLAELGELPRDIAIMGGAARAILQKQLFNESAAIRDIDLVQISDIAVSEDETLHHLSEKFMPDDYAHGHGVGSEELGEYFTERDFTINEVLVIDGKIVASQACIDDLKTKTIRPSYFERYYNEEYEDRNYYSSEDYEDDSDEYDEFYEDDEIIDEGPYSIGPKLSFKAMLLKAMFKVHYGTAQFDEDFYVHRHEPDGFFFALALNKAGQYEEDTSGVLAEFLQESYGTAGANPVKIACELSENLVFKFRGSKFAETVNQRLEDTAAGRNIIPTSEYRTNTPEDRLHPQSP